MFKISRVRRSVQLAIAVAFLLALGAPAAFADSAVFELSTGNSELLGGGNVGPYGTVSLVLNGDGSITVTVTANTSLGYGMFDAFGFNVADNDTAGLSISGGWSSFCLNTSPGCGQLDGFGSFDVVVAGPQQGNQDVSSFSFTVSRTNGFDSVFDLVGLSTGGNGGWSFAVHIQPNDGTETGWAGSGGNPIPEPGTLVLLGTGLFAMGGALRRRMKL